MKRRIRIAHVESRDMRVSAFVYGEWAAHPYLQLGDVWSDRDWTVTHVPTGRQIKGRVGVFTASDAKKAARRLSRECIEIRVNHNGEEARDEVARVIEALVAEAVSS